LKAMRIESDNRIKLAVPMTFAAFSPLCYPG
jgi:hypothetical protein